MITVSTLRFAPSASRPGHALPPVHVMDDDDPDTVIHTRPLPGEGSQHLSSPVLRQMPTMGHIGRYALKDVLGEGGLGTVYAAWDPLLSRAVAIKTLQGHEPSAANAQHSQELFLREARAAAALDHPHIVTVYDAGMSEMGPYIAMALLRGRDLRELLALGLP